MVYNHRFTRLFHLVSLFHPKIKSMGGLSVLYGYCMGKGRFAMGRRFAYWVMDGWRLMGKGEKIGKVTTTNC